MKFGDDVLHLRLSGVALLFKIGLILSGGLQRIFVLVQLVDKAFSRLIALERGQIVAIACLVVASFSFWLAFLIRLAARFS
ncbi:MAG TPA: hypothetical protein VGG45_05325 [Terracidiphilus sp.]